MSQQFVMEMPRQTSLAPPRIVIIGAGIGGLTAALRLRAKGYEVTICERHDWPGGKMRAVPSAAGPVDAGPTVLTLRHVLDDAFAATGARLDHYVDVIREPCLARHFWPDGSQLDLFDNRDLSARAIEAFAGPGAAQEFVTFAEDAQSLFQTFDGPMMQTADPRLPELAKAALRAPRHYATLAPARTLARHLAARFTDPRLRQLFGRYATYVGGSPLQSPALLSLIWRAEESGVWRVRGGMHCLASALARHFVEIGGSLHLGTDVARIVTESGRVCGVELANGTTLPAEAVVFAGDPRALGLGLLGPALRSVAPAAQADPRSLSARVWSFAAQCDGPDLLHHNVFFARTPEAEFTDLAAGRMPTDPTLYLCAQDRGSGERRPGAGERFQIILNAAADGDRDPEPKEAETCQRVTFQTLKAFGLTFSHLPDAGQLTTPTRFDALFPGSAGALYGQSPHGMTAALRRPRARTSIKGLFLAGGGVHPGAGVPMAALSGKHAAEAITAHLALT